MQKSIEEEILDKIIDIRITECLFLHPFYKDTYVSFKEKSSSPTNMNGNTVIKHISKIDYNNEVSHNDLVRLFEFIVRQQEDRMKISMIKHMNLRMYEKVFNGEAISVHDFQQIVHVQDVPKGLFPYVEMAYQLIEFNKNVDYCNVETGQWIQTIGRHYKTGLIFASHDNRFYDNPDYICLYLR